MFVYFRFSFITGCKSYTISLRIKVQLSINSEILPPSSLSIRIFSSFLILFRCLSVAMCALGIVSKRSDQKEFLREKKDRKKAKWRGRKESGGVKHKTHTERFAGEKENKKKLYS